MHTTFQYKGHNVEIEQSQEYVWLPLRYVFAIDGQYEFRLTAEASNRRLLKFPSLQQASNAAKRLIDAK